MIMLVAIHRYLPAAAVSVVVEVYKANLLGTVGLRRESSITKEIRYSEHHYGLLDFKAAL